MSRSSSNIIQAFCLGFNALKAGMMPDLDWMENPCHDAGRRLRTNGYNFAAFFSGGDWDYNSTVYRFPHVNEFPRMCHKCMASNNIAHLLFTTDGWRGTEVSHESYRALLIKHGEELPAPFLIEGLRLK